MDKIGRGLLIAIALLMGSQYSALAQQEDPSKMYEKIDEQTDEIYNQVVDWRRHFHQNPELSNREVKTAEYITDYLRDLGIKVETDIAHTGAEDFSFFQKEVPGLYWFVGGMPKGMESAEAPPHHTPDFYIEEEGMKLGIKSMVGLTVDYMNQYNSQ